MSRMRRGALQRQALPGARSGLCAVLLLSLSGTFLPLAGQEGRGAARRLGEALPPDAANRVIGAADAAAREGVPPGLVYRKALEGAAKGIPPERIAGAVEQYAARLREARGLVGPDRSPGTIGAAAEALRRGVPTEVVRSFADGHPRERDLAIPMIVLGELTEAGVPVDNALEVVNSVLSRGARGDQMLTLSAAVRRRMRQGEDWRQAIEIVRKRALERRDRMIRTRPDGGGQAARPGPHRRPLTSSPVPPGTEPPTRPRLASGAG